MATAKISLTDAWAPITAAGESGTCWLKTFPKTGVVVIDHSTDGAGSLDVDKSYPMKQHRRAIIDITADDTDDIFYAKCVDTGVTAELIVDVV